MDRRCIGDVCLAKAGARSVNLDLPLATVLMNPRVEWTAMARGRVRIARDIQVDWKEFTPDKYLFSHCFVPGTMVLMSDGTEKPIESVAEGDMVVSHTGASRRVKSVMSRNVDEELVVVKPASLKEAACTGEHPFYILPKEEAWCSHNRGWKKCVYGRASRCSKWGCEGNGGDMGFVRADALSEGDRVFTPTMSEVRDSGFTKERMRLLGYYVSEGGLATDERDGESNSVRFHISKKEKRTLGKEICSLMASCFGVVGHGTIEVAKEGGTTLSFASDEAYKWCGRHAGHIARDKRLSEDVMFAAPELQAEMLDTWIAGDGHLDASKRSVRLSTASLFLASQAEVIFSRIGGLANVYEGVNPGGPTARWRKFPIFQVSAKSSDLGAIRERYSFPQFSRWSRTGQRYRHAACSVSEIRSVDRRAYRGPVYNLSVDVDESYVANRMAVHNCTIVASVATEKNGYYVKPACTDLVNNNGNGWTNPVLMATFRTFLGAENYLEHVQIPELSKGKILDAVLRPLAYEDEKGQKADIFYCDILVATNRKHSSLVRKIESGSLGTMSMGCLADWVQCSRCGVVLGDNDPNCTHIDNELLRVFTDDDGIERITAELCGRSIKGKDGKLEGDPKSVKFIEASWVEKPAFYGAVINHYVSEVPKAAKMLTFSTAKLSETMEDLFKLRVADTNGMIVLKVAQAELMRRKRELIAAKVARSMWA